MAVLVNESDVVARQGLAHGVQLVRVFVRPQAAAAAAFGHSVVLDQAAGPARQDVGLQSRREGCAGAELRTE